MEVYMALPVENHQEDTIAAVATAMTEAGIGIIRISGPDAIAIGDLLFRDSRMRRRLSTYPANTIHFGYIIDPDMQNACSTESATHHDEIIDEVMVSVMKHPHSYTTEDTVEINSHGGVYLLNRILQVVLHHGARMAEPGEFTKRAVLGGRIDLARAEAVMDLISSRSEFARKVSLEQLEGSVSDKIQNYRSSILYELAFLESALDDPENYDTTGYPQKLDAKLMHLIGDMNQMLKDSESGRILQEGIRTVIVGKPNAGKSSLLNLMSHSDRAIVTDIAGTTRDTLEEQVRVGDLLLNLVDTAGIHETQEPVEKIGVDRAIQAADSADLLLFLLDSADKLSEEDRRIAALVENRVGEGGKAILLLNKSDLYKSDLSPQTTVQDIRTLFKELVPIEKGITFDNKKANIQQGSIPCILFSMKDRTGWRELQQTMEEMFHAGELQSRNEVFLTNERQREAVRNAVQSLELVRGSIADGMSEEFFSLDLMNAYSELGKILGEQVDDDLVEEIFSKFCLGK